MLRSAREAERAALREMQMSELFKHTVFCNVLRYTCEVCRKYRSYCLSHREPTRNNRCDCDYSQPMRRKILGTAPREER